MNATIPIVPVVVLIILVLVAVVVLWALILRRSDKNPTGR
jgi:hypothetical protein